VQRSFIDDLYSGALLNDKSQEEIDKMDQPAHPSVEDLMREEEMDAAGVEGVVNPNANVDPNKRDSDLEGDALDAYLESMMESHEDVDEDDEDNGGNMEIDDGSDDFL